MTLVNLKQSSLTEQQKEAIDLLVGKEGDLTQQEIADRVGVSRQSLFNWRKKPEFRQALVEQAKTITDTGLAYSLTWMEQAMKDPLVKDSVKVQIAGMFMKNHGMLKDMQETTVKSESTISVEDALRKYNIK
ncbi:hypothetical protein BH739_09040 [Enterococcus casseliflavus]|nr:hypothetical protein BH739_09040 [Enterococcus casseliflavus]